jgi:putative RNA 2'-phosphotransferase
MRSDLIKISKFLSMVLRHSPEAIHLTLDKNGWANINELIGNANTYKRKALDIDIIKNIVATNDKQRFCISDDGKKIRANQGHSINVDLELACEIPPDILYHGTAYRFLGSIMKDGLKPMARQHVHLSLSEDKAVSVGIRHGRPVVLCINAKGMHEKGYKFYLSKNKVWLTDKVPVEFIKVKGSYPASGGG